MPGKGMTGITLKDEVAQLLRAKAAANNQGLNEYLSGLLLGPFIQQHEDRPETVQNHVIQQVSLVGHL